MLPHFCVLAVVGVVLVPALYFALMTPSADHPSEGPYTIRLLREQVPVHRKGQIVSYKTSYSGVVNVGNPNPQDFRVVFDTGSGHVILPSVDCDSPACLMHRRYNMSQSQSAMVTNVNGDAVSIGAEIDEVTIGFGTGQVTGQFIHETLCIGGEASGSSKLYRPCVDMQVVTALDMSDQPFKRFTFDGIVGLGLPSLAIAPGFSFFHRLAEFRPNAQPHFAVFLSEDDSELTIGGHNPKRLSGQLSWVPVAKPELGHWQVSVVAIRISGHDIGGCGTGECRAIMDSGTSHIGVPGHLLSRVAELTTRTSDEGDDCRYVSAPIIELEFHGLKVIVRPEDYMRQLPLRGGIDVESKRGVRLPSEAERLTMTTTPLPLALRPKPVGSDDNTTFFCRPRLMPVSMPEPLGPNLFIIGEPLLHRYYTVYDHLGPSIGFGLAKHGGIAEELPTTENQEGFLQQHGDEVVLMQTFATLDIGRARKQQIAGEILLVRMTLEVRS